MSVIAGPNYRRYKTALELLTMFPQLYGKDNYYALYPQGPDNQGVLTWCDMTTDGGGWMLIARSHPSIINYNGQNWGWRGGPIGSVKDFTQAYQLGWFTEFEGFAIFDSFLFGNRLNINNNKWGPFIYKNSDINYLNLINTDTQQSANRSTIKFDTNVYGSSSYPTMQNAIGFPITGTNNNIYYLRDCCGFSSSYGGRPTFFGTTYCNRNDRYSSGPWCNGSSIDIDEDFVQGGTAYGSYIHGGTNQYMIMVR